MKAVIPLLALGSLPCAYAWGFLAHETVAYVAQNFVSAQTKTFCQGLLSDTSTSYLANVATWADSFRTTTAGKYSAPYHFIDAEDSPPSACNVDYARDCGASGCVVSAINNYTSRVRSTTLPQEQVLQALKFLVHFIGDIHQPLHDEALNLGGNTIPVTFNGSKTNLHAVWDTAIPEYYTHGAHALADAQKWATTLTAQIKTGSYSTKKAGWVAGLSLQNPVTTATGWATEANKYVCSTALPNGVAATETGDLDGAYYQSAIPVVQLLVATAGYRLAAWLNLIATGSTGGL
ncbi:MAG: hypothetical protein Q9187_002726 [Circinaria calcarea]